MAGVVFKRVAKVYPGGTRAVDDLSLDIRDGEFVVIVGPSGSGETTALRMVAGPEEISEATVSIGGRVVNYIPTRNRDIARCSRATRCTPTYRSTTTSPSDSG